ncbi:hypothetical protein FB451DRAFT_1247708 [Mycena latifolia]|nr:hypothetical protein FB451DRAFT_1247708 [Mycena latifolia]
MGELAPELADHIIDCCDIENENAMKSCGLVGRKWLRRSRYHLFSQVSLNAKNLGSFVDLVESSSLPILSFIRHLELEYCGSPLETILLGRLHRCPSLTRIDIRVVDASEAAVWLNSFSALHTHLQSWNDNSDSISHLDLRFGSFIELPLRTILNIVSCIPCIEQLGIYGPSRLSKYTDVLPSFAPSLLAHLDLHGLHQGGQIFSWLLSLPILPTLKSLGFTGSVQSDDINSIEAYLQRTGNEIETLDIEIRGKWADAVFFQRRIFPYTTKLRNFVFTCPSPSALLHTLALLPASEYWNIIDVTVYDPEDGDLQWMSLDTALADPSFRTLRGFSLKSTRNMITPQTKVLMPLANARGILK